MMNGKIALLIMISMVIGGLLGYGLHYKMSFRDMKELSYYKDKYQFKSGWTEGYGSYQLESFDGGMHWYAVSAENDTVIVKGSAEEVFPGLLAHLEAWDNLIKYVEENGPITLNGDRSAKDISVLNKAGFTVKAK